MRRLTRNWVVYNCWHAAACSFPGRPGRESRTTDLAVVRPEEHLGCGIANRSVTWFLKWVFCTACRTEIYSCKFASLAAIVRPLERSHWTSRKLITSAMVRSLFDSPAHSHWDVDQHVAITFAARCFVWIFFFSFSNGALQVLIDAVRSCCRCFAKMAAHTRPSVSGSADGAPEASSARQWWGVSSAADDLLVSLFRTVAEAIDLRHGRNVLSSVAYRSWRVLGHAVAAFAKRMQLRQHYTVDGASSRFRYRSLVFPISPTVACGIRFSPYATASGSWKYDSAI